MRRMVSLFALVAILVVSAPSSFAARSQDTPHERPGIVKMLKKLIRILGDEMIVPKP
jgi:hypothetical protein